MLTCTMAMAPYEVQGRTSSRETGSGAGCTVGEGADVGCDVSLTYVFLGISGNCANVFDAMVDTKPAATDVNMMAGARREWTNLCPTSNA